MLAQAERAEAPGGSIHGYRTIADIMRSYNPFVGETYREALVVSRVTREMCCLMEVLLQLPELRRYLKIRSM